MCDIVGNIGTFLNFQDVPNNYIILDGRHVAKDRFYALWHKIQFSPKLYKGFKISDEAILVPDYTGYYLKHDKDHQGNRGVDTIRTPETLNFKGSFPIPHSASPPADMFDGKIFRSDQFTMGKFCDPVATNLTTRGFPTPDMEVNYTTTGLDWTQIDFRLSTNNSDEKPNEDHIGKVTEPQNVSVVYAICGSDIRLTYGLLYPDGSGKKFLDGTITKFEDQRTKFPRSTFQGVQI